MNFRYQYEYAAGLLKRYGFWGLVLKTLERKNSPMREYASHYRRYLPTEEELKEQRNTPLAFAPLVSIVVPLFETPEEYLCALTDSVLEQTYPNWELCLADGSRTERVKKTVERYEKRDSRIRYKRLTENGGISENTNRGLAMANGSYIAFMDHDDLIAPNALYEMVRCLNGPCLEGDRKTALLYSDEDKIDSGGTVHTRPHFKPDFNLEFLRHNNYICHFLMFSKELLKKAGGLQKEYDGAQDYDFVLRCVDAGAKVYHVPKILYHWRIHEGSTAGNSGDKSYAFDNGCRAIEAHLKRRGEQGRAFVTPNLGVYRIRYTLSGPYRITVVSESGDMMKKIRAYYGETYKRPGYSLSLRYETGGLSGAGIENGYPGDYILYIRNGVCVQPEGLLEKLLGICQRKDTGLAAAKLLTAGRRVLSCGMAYGNDGGLTALCGGLPASYKGSFLHAAVPQNVSAVSFGCVLFKKEAYVKAGGLKSGFTGIYRDADVCFRLLEQGYGIVVTPEVTAVCKKPESPADGRTRFCRKWKEKLTRPDPCYNCNLSLEEGRTYAMRDAAQGE